MQGFVKYLIIGLSAIFLVSYAAFAQEGELFVSSPQQHISGERLKGYCAGHYDVDAGYCAGYVTAISEIMMDHAVYGMTACNHGPVKAQQLAELVRMQISLDPLADKQPASVVASRALAKSFPCRY